jgi:hypothetical protein
MRKSRKPKINVLNHKKLFAGWALLCLSLGCTAATLGPAQGAAWIGRPLQLTVPVQLAEGEELTPDCLEADVFHADARQATRALQLAVEPSPQSPLGRVVRIVSPSPVDEPVVTVYLRAGCGQKNSRRYVLLAELPAVPREQAQPKVALAAQPEKITQARKPPTPPLERKRMATDVAKPAPAANLKGKSRLKLELPDLTEEGDLVLRSTSELTILPEEDPLRRAAAVALWRAMTASPQDTLHDDARLQGMQNDVNVLQTISVQNQRHLVQLARRLETAQAERDASWQVYVLGALLLITFVAMVLLWRRRAPPVAQNE